VSDEHVHGHAFGRPGDQGIDIQTADQVANVGGQRGQPHNRARHRGLAAGRRAPGSVHRAGEPASQHLAHHSVPERARAGARAHNRDRPRLQQRPEYCLRLGRRDNHPVSVRRALAPATPQLPAIAKPGISIKIILRRRGTASGG